MYYRVNLTEKVQTSSYLRGSDFCVCRAPDAAAAVRQLLPSMREKVAFVEERAGFRECYPEVNGILR